MRNYTLDFNNMNAIIIKKSYLKKVVSNTGWEALEAADLRKDGFTLKDGTHLTVKQAEQCWTNKYFSQALKSV